ncbi:MAG: PAS domain-containing protein [Alphaproteobacteria bacterium]|nr:PAS domain-containing protein [Alphaproteobacteria bacterium]MDE2014294.1 PAS domain-containing protein [Alphaproteobacteria bacterium]
MHHFPQGEFAKRSKEALDLIHCLWNLKRGDRPLPSRSDFTLHDLRPVIHNVSFIGIERDERGAVQYKIRFMGDGLVQVLGNHTGSFIQTSFDQRVAEKFRKHFGQVEAATVPLRFSGTMTELKRTYLQHRTLIAPLSDNGKFVDGHMCSIFFGASEDVETRQ